MASIVPSPIRVVHIPRWLSTDRDPETGNHEVVEGTPVIRRAQSLAQYGRGGSSYEAVNDEVTERNVTDIQMACADPTLYEPSDLVIINPEFDANGDWITDSGETHWVNGEPYDMRTGPWTTMLAVFGGTVKLRRVT